MKTRLLSPKAAATLERLRSFKVTPEVAARVQAFEARQTPARTPVAAATTETTVFKPTTEVPTMELGKTLTVRNDQLRRHLDLPDYADEAVIRAALRCAPPFKEIQAAAASRRPVVRASAPAPVATARPLLDAAARVQAASDGELTRLAASPLTGAERDAVGEELAHRRLVGSHFPDLADGARGGRARIRHYD